MFETWAWDFTPLHPLSWGNSEVKYEDNIIEAGEAAHRIRDPGTEFERARNIYVPTEDDLAIIKRHFPRRDPRDPPWLQIKARLMAAQLDKDRDLINLEAPVIVAMLGTLGHPDLAKTLVTDPPRTEKPPIRKKYDRDHQFLEWKQQGMGNAAIRDLWNKNNPEDKISLESNDRGLSLVRNAIRAAENDLKIEGG